MNRYQSTLAIVVCITVVLLIGQSSRGDVVLTFDDFGNLPPVDDFRSLNSSNGGSSTYGGAVWDSRFYVVGDEYVERFYNQGGTNPFATPQSGNYAMFNANGDNGLTISTDLVFTGAWFSRPDMGIGPRGTNEVTVFAMGNGIELGSATVNLVDSTPVFLDMSSFLGLTGIDGYRFDRVAVGGDGYGGDHYVVDSIRVSAVPEPASLGLFLGGTAGLCYLRRRKQAAA